MITDLFHPTFAEQYELALREGNIETINKSKGGKNDNLSRKSQRPNI